MKKTCFPSLTLVLLLVGFLLPRVAAACVSDTECDDADVCNGVETCIGGVCQPGTPLDCSDGNPCTADGCDPVAGCQYVPVSDATPCDDATICNGAETCLGGLCTPGSPLDCDDANVCTADTCDPVAGCQYAAVPDGSPCADGTVCNGAETCAAGACAPGTPLDCDDANICTADTCDPLAGCQHAAVVDGTTCADGTVCNGAET